MSRPSEAVCKRHPRTGAMTRTPRAQWRMPSEVVVAAITLPLVHPECSRLVGLPHCGMIVLTADLI